MKKGELEARNQLSKSRYINLQHVWSIISQLLQLEKLLERFNLVN
jgi:hypothetical protein